MKNICIVLFLFLFYSCSSQDCDKLPESFNSYPEAIKLVKKSQFKITESASTPNSSWIKSAKYYSCDGKQGCFIYTTNTNREYIHYGLPMSVWIGFKNASSKGTYYNASIKNRYQLVLN